MSEAMIRLRGLNKYYQMDDVVIKALDGVDQDIKKGEFVSISGPSGAGKSTLLHLIGCLDTPTHGEVMINGETVGGMKDRELTLFRKANIGFVFQFFNLVPTLTALENVLVPKMFDKDRNVGKAKALLETVGMGHRLNHRSTELSGGERQRVAIARALVNSPPILLADEPTGNLDSETGNEILALFKRLNGEGKTVILVTHERDIARYADHAIGMKDGKVMARCGVKT